MASPGAAPARSSIDPPMAVALRRSTLEASAGPGATPKLARLAAETFPIHLSGKLSVLKDMDFLHRPADDARQVNRHDIPVPVLDGRGAAHFVSPPTTSVLEDRCVPMLRTAPLGVLRRPLRNLPPLFRLRSAARRLPRELPIPRNRFAAGDQRLQPVRDRELDVPDR